MRCLLFILLGALLVSAPVCGQCVGPASPGPHNEDFDSAVAATSTFCGTTDYGTYPSGWTLDPSSTNAWKVRSGGTPTADTGPTRDATGSPCSPGNYVYTETTGSCAGMVAILVAPCVDVASMVSPGVSFRYHMYGSDMGTLEVQVRELSGVWTSIWSASGEGGDSWRYTEVPLTVPFNPAALELRFVGTAGPGYLSDMALDDITIGAAYNPPVWETNDPAAHLDANLVQTDGFDRAQTDSSLGTLTIATTNVGEPWELVISPSPLVPPSQGGFLFPDAQIANIDLSSNFSFLNGGAMDVPFPASIPGLSIPSGSIVLPYCVTSSAVSLQALHLDSTAPLGFVLSQGAELHPGPITLHLGDDEAQVLDLSCLCPGGIPFYGTMQDPSRVKVTSNGRVMFGLGALDYTATPSEALQGAPFIGFWTDLDPSLSGSILITMTPSNVLRFEFACLPYFEQATATAYLTIEIDCGSGGILLDSLSLIQPNPTPTLPGDSQFLGLSPGVEAGATDPGATLFTLGGTGGVLTPTDMLYDYLDGTSTTSGLVPSLQPGNLTSIALVPDTSGNYTWQGL